MSVEAMAVCLHHSRAQGTAKVILLGIANHDGDGGAWPSIATLAKYAGYTGKPESNAKAVRRQLRRLGEHLPECHHDCVKHLGEIRVHTQQGGPREMEDFNRPNRYDVLVSCPPSCDRTTRHRDVDEGLWITPRVNQPGGGQLTRGRGGSTNPPNHPYLTNDPSSPALVTGPRATTPPCVECSAPDLDACISRQARIRRADRHEYRPRPSSSKDETP